MKKHLLSADGRKLVGRKVKQLRKQGMLPATVYGKNVKSTSITVKTKDFEKIYKAAGETGLIDLTLDKGVLPVLIHHIQVDPVTSELLHVEFHQVDLKEKVTANVPLVMKGESPAVAQKLGVVLFVLDEVEIEALPTELPEHIFVDISGLKEVNAELKISDLKMPTGVILHTDPSLTVVKIAALVSKEAEVQVAAEEAAAAAAKTTETGEAITPKAAPTTEPQEQTPQEKSEQPKSS